MEVVGPDVVDIVVERDKAELGRTKRLGKLERDVLGIKLGS